MIKRVLFLAIIPVIAFSQIHSRVEVAKSKITKYKSDKKLVMIETECDGKKRKLTSLDAVFASLVGSDNVDIKKSEDIGYTNMAKELIEVAKKEKPNKRIIMLKNERGNVIKYDLDKENESSVLNGVKISLKNGYKQEKSVASDGNGKDK